MPKLVKGYKRTTANKSKPRVTATAPKPRKAPVKDGKWMETRRERSVNSGGPGGKDWAWRKAVREVGIERSYRKSVRATKKK